MSASPFPLPDAGWIACKTCDLLLRRPVLGLRSKAHCPRCGKLLDRSRPDSLNRTLALALASLVLYVVAQASMFMSFELDGLVQEARILTGIQALFADGKWPLASLILLTAVLAPLLWNLSLIWILVPLRLGARPPAAAAVMRFCGEMANWAMLEVFLLAVLVTYSKLVAMAHVGIGPGGWAFGLLILVSAGTTASFDAEVAWDRIEAAR
jgi:paraquat-inducible protein A